MSYILQKVGSGLWIGSLVLLFLKEIVLCYLALAAVLVIDLILVKKKEKTITQWYRTKLPKLADTILTIAVVVIFIWCHNPVVGLYFLQGTIHGHLNGDWLFIYLKNEKELLMVRSGSHSELFG
ncbi:hypothetical protein LCGC14_3050770 [marine sediment metagenome]|uniref:Uncharacterized protein n=1 Tax=marine sediment metagenome TaxID=412755 RepID=A0A0F8WM80_9ZZZZ